MVDGRANPNKSEAIEPIALTAEQRTDVVELLLSLSDSDWSAIRDSRTIEFGATGPREIPLMIIME